MTLKLKVDLRPKERPRLGKYGKFYSPVDTSHIVLQKMYKYYMHQNNILKGIQDCGNKILWYDDKQIIGYDKIRLFRNSENPRLILQIEPQNYLLEN